MRIRVLTCVSVLALGACASGAGSSSAATASSAPNPGTAPAASSGTARSYISRVTALGTSGTQLFGVVRLAPTGKPNEYNVTIELRGAKLGNRIPWAIGTGQCGETSRMEIGDRVQYRNIEATADGSANARSTLRVAIPENATLHVNFYASPTDREHVVSCGPLVPG